MITIPEPPEPLLKPAPPPDPPLEPVVGKLYDPPPPPPTTVTLTFETPLGTVKVDVPTLVKT